MASTTVQPTDSVPANPAVVVFPGAWHYASAYASFCKFLEDQGYHADCVVYPSMGAEPPNKTLSHDSAAGRIILEQLVNGGREVIVLCHSYGGIVGQNAVYGLSATDRAKHGQPGGIIGYIYMAAFALPKYATILSVLGEDVPPWLEFDGTYVRAMDPIGTFFDDCDNPELLLKYITHASAGVFVSPVLHEPWHDIPCTYIACSKDQGLPHHLQQKFSDVIGPQCTVVTLPCGHSPFIKIPEQVLKVIKAQKFLPVRSL